MRIAIVGMGLIGTSVALAARRAWPSLEITEVDRHQPLDSVAGAETIILAAPVDANIRILTEHGRRFAASAITDVGSSKRAVLAAARAQGLTNFVGGHPMAGAASSGPGEARADMFDERPWFLFSRGADNRSVARVRALVEALRARPVLMDDDGSEHDRMLAAVSHLPQIVASTLMKVVGEAAPRGLEWAGNGLRDTTRLAASSAGMWESVLTSNADELRPLLLKLADDLRSLAGRLDDLQAIRALFTIANDYRRQLPSRERQHEATTDTKITN